MGDGEDDQFINGLQNEVNELRTKNAQLNTALSSYANSREDGNALQVQLDTEILLDKIRHFLKGEYVAIDENNNEYWETPQDKNLVLFNDYGVNQIMLIITSYIDKGTILSIYSEERIYEILADIGDELIKFFFCNYEKMGMDTEFKKTRFELTVLTILHSIESAYRRAIRGDTFKDLNSSRIFTQVDALNKTPSMQQKKFSIFKPSTW